MPKCAPRGANLIAVDTLRQALSPARDEQLAARFRFATPVWCFGNAGRADRRSDDRRRSFPQLLAAENAVQARFA
jgi:hypothetical protein